MLLSAPREASGKIEIPGLHYSKEFNVKPGSVIVVRLPREVDPGNLNGATGQGIANLGIHVTSTDDISVYGLNQMKFTTDAYLALPVDALGKQYVVSGWQSSSAGQYSQATLVASEDNTQLTIVPSVNLNAQLVQGVPFSVTLDKGQIYQLQASNLLGDDLTGTTVASTKPVALYSGNTCANVPVGFTACDHLVEQTPPTSTWGTSFVTLPLATRTKGDTFRFLASQNGTEVRVNGNIVATLNATTFIDFNLPSGARAPFTIEATKPILVTQFSNGQGYDGVAGADPFMVYVPPKEQFLADYTFATPATGFPSNFANVIIPTNGINGLQVDGTNADQSLFSPIGTSGYSGAQIPITNGSHSIKATVPFGLTVYGYSSFDSYGYTGGMSFARIADVQSIAITPPSESAPQGATRSVTATALDASGQPIPGARIDFRVTGANAVSGFAFTNQLGQAVYSYTGAVAGNDTITASIGNKSATASKTWTSVIPIITVQSPNNGSDFVENTSILFTGKATPGNPAIPIAAVFIDGVRVDALDRSGNFFTRATIPLGRNSFQFTTVDANGNTASTTVQLTGSRISAIQTVRQLSDVSTIAVDYGVTSWNKKNKELHAELSIRNSGTYSIQTPILVGITNISDSSVVPTNIDGVTDDGVPYYDFSQFVADGILSPNESSGKGVLTFRNPSGTPFTYKIQLLGQLNRSPRFTSVPNTTAVVGTQYRYPLTSFDPTTTLFPIGLPTSRLR